MWKIGAVGKLRREGHCIEEKSYGKEVGEKRSERIEIKLKNCEARNQGLIHVDNFSGRSCYRKVECRTLKKSLLGGGRRVN